MRNILILFVLFFSSQVFSALECEYYSSSYEADYSNYGVYGSLFDGEVRALEFDDPEYVTANFYGGEYWDASSKDFSCTNRLEEGEKTLCRNFESKEKDSFFLQKTAIGYRAYSNPEDYRGDKIVFIDFKCDE